jgi:hypothetical protein
MSGSLSALEYVMVSSEISLEAFGLSQMSSAAKFQTEVLEVVDQWICAEVGAGFSRLMVECLRRQPRVSPMLFDSSPHDESIEGVAIALRSGYVEIASCATEQSNLNFVSVIAEETRAVGLHYLQYLSGALGQNRRRAGREHHPGQHRERCGARRPQICQNFEALGRRDCLERQGRTFACSEFLA